MNGNPAIRGDGHRRDDRGPSPPRPPPTTVPGRIGSALHFSLAAAGRSTYQGDGRLHRQGVNVSNLNTPSSYGNPDDASLPIQPYVFIGSRGLNPWCASAMAVDDVRVCAGLLTSKQIGTVRGVATIISHESAVPKAISADVEQHSPPGGPVRP